MQSTCSSTDYDQIKTDSIHVLPDMQTESRSENCLDKLELSRRPVAVGIYTIFAGLDPVLSKLLLQTTLTSLARVDLWIAKVVHTCTLQETRGGCRRKQYVDIFGQILQVATSQQVGTVQRFV